MNNNTLGFVMSDVTRLMRNLFKKRLKGQDLTLVQARALFYIARFEGVRQVELADMLEIKPISLVRLIDLLVEADLIERRPDPKDRRAYQIYLSATAQPHIDEILSVIKSIQDDALAGLSEAEIATVTFAFEKMRRNLSAL
ncbi:MarR family winged helix-turn-helix transcriptional regulator [Photobacterium halotolerans]|uniref:MarR family transcriptional regulator n=1 Tax=Photobacterium halotolerans TaxID=265726 RepID=A0A7X4WQY0_9GAMM|nr:MarR family transcriptional regulator [Photobacterium halotolerans]NAW64792.1 MarR family transcriptional regulator [Photobacterium halotolerans]NAW87209.1 MarR family transcriptional regulator [Photobacterium halotolerans]NAX47409.1 MarR family transcriptional regulator [Photobacterium halotolerans]